MGVNEIVEQYIEVVFDLIDYLGNHIPYWGGFLFVPRSYSSFLPFVPSWLRRRLMLQGSHFNDLKASRHGCCL